MRNPVTVLIMAAALAACTPGEPMPPTPTPRPGTGLPAAEPRVRIGIVVDSSTAQVGAATGFAIRVAGGDEIMRGAAGETWTFSADAQGFVSARGPAGVIRPRAASLRVIPDQPGGLTINGRRYRGEAMIIPRSGGRVSALNIVELEEYLLGVVPREIGRLPASMIEATKAQAIAARTYAVGNLGGRETLGFDFHATVMDQVYGGMADEDTIVNRAVRETAGEILTYNGSPILAYYSSTCGGRTASIEDSWTNRQPLPYLRSVSDRIPGTEEYYCSTSNRFNWSTEWTRPQLLAVLGETLRSHTRGVVQGVSRLDGVRIVDRNASGRATVELSVDGRDYTLRGDSIRWVLRPQPGPAILNSSLLHDIETVRGPNGIESIEVHGGGWGHAIGMCQVGAMGRARAGQSYSEILRAYYTGVEVRRLY
ncbi:MAG: SpoIID/LytB domain-containing protein [Gemmatimonadetes bacterium]|nr:SpoIID/LytB domain-containing protein [Gemmatimonadota bacterium]